jgi:hypothetical protein
MLHRRDTFELSERAFPISPVVKQMPQIDAGLMKVCVESERTTDLSSCADLVSESMKSVPQ